MPVSINNTQVVFNDATTQTSAASNGIQGLSVFNSPGNFAAPPGTSKIYVVATGGGGGGGGNVSTPETFAPGGPGGASAIGVGVYSVTGGSNYAITVGAAGTAGVTNGTNGNPGGAGGATSIGSLLTCNGGNGGVSAGGGGNPGNPGTAPLATTSANAQGSGPGVYSSSGVLTVSNTAGRGGDQAAAGGAGKVLIYF